LSNSVYLVTVKHVLFLPAEGTNLPALRAPFTVVQAFASAGGTNSSQRAVLIDLACLLAAGEIRTSTNRDVAIVRIEECDTNDWHVVHSLPGVQFVTPMVGLDVNGPEWIGRFNTVDVGADVFMFGYPASLTSKLAGIFGPNEPLVRKGIVAGVSAVSKTIVIDCPSYQGNSGGPVLQVDHPMLGMTSFHVIGLVSGFIPFEEEWENKTMQYSHVLKSNSARSRNTISGTQQFFRLSQITRLLTEHHYLREPQGLTAKSFFAQGQRQPTSCMMWFAARSPTLGGLRFCWGGVLVGSFLPLLRFGGKRPAQEVTKS
jgi:hypothetical protein